MKNNYPSEFWQYKNPTSVGLTDQFLDNLDEYIRKNSHRIKSFIIVKNNSIIFEEYYHQGSEEVLNNQMSITKSINSIIMGIAIDKGYFDSEKDLVIKYLPKFGEYGELNKQVTIKHLLQMTNGMIRKSEAFKVPMLNPIISSDKPLDLLMKIPILEETFETFSYNTVTAAFIVELIRSQIDTTYEEFADKYLFSPLGITEYEWAKSSRHTGYLLSLKTQDLARIGLLMLRNGSWMDQQIISSDWIKRSLNPGVFDQYGYQWWLKPNTNIFYGTAYGGQSLICVPDHDMIIAGNCHTREGDSGGKRVNEIFFEYILPKL